MRLDTGAWIGLASFLLTILVMFARIVWAASRIEAAVTRLEAQHTQHTLHDTDEFEKIDRRLDRVDERFQRHEQHVEQQLRDAATERGDWARLQQGFNSVIEEWRRSIDPRVGREEKRL